MEKEDINKELHEIAPGLSKLGKENFLHVPADYFTRLPEQIIDRIHSQQRAGILDVILVYLMKYSFPVIASSVLILAGYFYFNYQKATEELSGFDQIAWYAEYHSGSFYEVVLSGVNEGELYLDFEEDPTDIYLSDYYFYYLHEMTEDVPSGESFNE
jgi:hypothetical protein